MLFRRKRNPSTPRQKLGGEGFKGIKKPRFSSAKRKPKRNKRPINPTQIAKTLVIVVFTALLLVVFAFSFRYIVKLRQSKSDRQDNVLTKEGFVIGFDDVPAYPNSEFIYENDRDNQAVEDFLSQGKSVYRVPINTNFSDIKDFYRKALKPYKWEHVNSIAVGDAEHRFGEYWVKGDVGLRVYSRLNDIWYERISIDQAKTALADDVKKEVERELLLAKSDSSPLLPDFPWDLNVPVDYTVSYRVTDIANLSAADFRKIGANETIILEPIGFIGGKPYDYFLDDFINKYNQSHSQEKNFKQWSVINSAITSKGDQEIVRATITNGAENGESVVLWNAKNNAVYVITTFKLNDPMFNFIVDNIQPKPSSY